MIFLGTLLEFGRVQRLAFESSQCVPKFLARAGGQRKASTVYLVTNQGLATMGEVHSYLVCPTGLKLNTYISVGQEPFKNAIMRNRRLAIFLDAHLQTINRVPTYRRIYFASAGQYALAYGEVMPGYFPVRQGPDECRMRLECLADEQQATGFLVQPVNYTGAWQLGGVGQVVQQPVH